MGLINTIPPAPANPLPVTQGFIQSTQKKNIGYDRGVLDPVSPMMFSNIPPGTASAILVVEAAQDSTADVIARHRSDGMWPDAVNGMPICHLSAIELIGADDVRNLRLISADGKQHIVHINYYQGQ